MFCFLWARPYARAESIIRILPACSLQGADLGGDRCGQSWPLWLLTLLTEREVQGPFNPGISGPWVLSCGYYGHPHSLGTSESQLPGSMDSRQETHRVGRRSLEPRIGKNKSPWPVLETGLEKRYPIGMPRAFPCSSGRPSHARGKQKNTQLSFKSVTAPAQVF